MQTPESKRTSRTLEDVTLGTCSKAWSSLEPIAPEGEPGGVERTRYCGDCQLHVHDLSAYTRDEATELVSEREGRLCVMKTVLPSGEVRTLPGVPETRRTSWLSTGFARIVGGAASLLALLFGTALTACTRAEDEVNVTDCDESAAARPGLDGEERRELLETMEFMGYVGD